MDKANDFYQQVYDLVRQIPYGKVTTYGHLAARISTRGSARMVGWALNSTKYHLDDIPAHRVVNRKGLLTGKRYFGGSHTMADLLQSEGIEIVHDQIQNLEKYLWIP
jgi:methylated-DNA-protein-cysteine methyltransferase-like protein